MNMEEMKVRKVVLTDREAMLTSFKPLFGDWDYLPLVIDDWLSPSTKELTWVVESDSMLIAMWQVLELEPGDWYLHGLRSNPKTSLFQIGCAILGMKRVIQKKLEARGARTLRYGTLPWFQQSLRMGALFGFKEHFRLGHRGHPLPEIPDEAEGIKVDVPEEPSSLLKYFRESSTLKPVGGYFFTWWDTRQLREKHLVEARSQSLLFTAMKGRQMVGAAMFWHIPWQKFLVLSIMEGTDQGLKTLYEAGVSAARRLECNTIGMVHPSLEEMHRRQALFSLEPSGCDTVQLIYHLYDTRGRVDKVEG